MTTKYLITSRRANALAAYESAAVAAAAVEDQPSNHVREDIFRMLADAADEVLSVAASTLGDVRQKLEVYWGDLDDSDYGSDWKRMILGDLMRLYLLDEGVSWDEASGEMDLDKVQTNWAEAAANYDRCRDLSDYEPASRPLETSTGTETPVDAEDRLLRASAPSLSAVLKKLAVLWSDDRLDPVFNSIGHAQILRDLRRLGCAAH